MEQQVLAPGGCVPKTSTPRNKDGRIETEERIRTVNVLNGNRVVMARNIINLQESWWISYRLLMNGRTMGKEGGAAAPRLSLHLLGHAQRQRGGSPASVATIQRSRLKTRPSHKAKTGGTFTNGFPSQVRRRWNGALPFWRPSHALPIITQPLPIADFAKSTHRVGH